MKFAKLFTILSISVFALACSKKNSNDNAGAGTGGTVTGTGSNIILSIHYFKGGFFAPPNQPNWSRDLTVDFTQYLPQYNGYRVHALHPDPLCFKADGVMTQTQATDLINLVTQLQLYVSNGPFLPDIGVEYIEFTMQDGTKRRYHLMNGDVPAGEYYASNPTDVSTYLKTMDNSLPVACQ